MVLTSVNGHIKVEIKSISFAPQEEGSEYLCMYNECLMIYETNSL